MKRREKKFRMMEVQELRAAVEGLPASVSPARLLGSTGAQKVEAFYARVGGKRGAVILSFESTNEKQRAMELESCNYTELPNACSSRANSSAWHRIRTPYA